MNSQLTLEKLNLKVNLGYSAEERSFPQWISLRVQLSFTKLPLACINDNLNDTLCYASLSEDLQNFCNGRSFKLIEALTYQLYQFLKKKISAAISEQNNVFLCITKSLQLPTLEKSSFSINDYNSIPSHHGYMGLDDIHKLNLDPPFKQTTILSTENSHRE